MGINFRSDGLTYRRTDGWTDGWMDERTDGWNVVVAIVFHVIPTESTHVLSYCDDNITCVLLVSETRVISMLLIVITKHLFFLHCSIITFLYIPQFSFSPLSGALETIVTKRSCTCTCTSKPFLVPDSFYLIRILFIMFEVTRFASWNWGRSHCLISNQCYQSIHTSIHSSIYIFVSTGW